MLRVMYTNVGCAVLVDGELSCGSVVHVMTSAGAVIDVELMARTGGVWAGLTDDHWPVQLFADPTHGDERGVLQ